MSVNRNIKYTELSRAKVSEARNIVISSCSKGGFTIAQQLEAKEGEKITAVFMKNAFHVDDLDGLYNLRDAVNLAIEICEGKHKSEDKIDWDEE